jgi:Tetratricopeptide repeat/AAA ATPase domain
VAIGTLAYRRPVGPSVPVSLPPRPALLAGRESLLAQLRAALGGGTSPGPRIVVLHGLGGVGKTSLAVEYAYQAQPQVTAAWQLRAEDRLVLASDINRLADQLGARDPFDAREPAASLHSCLAARETPWLLIFDNVISQQAIAEFLPPAGPGQVIITTQNPNWSIGQRLEVPVLAPGVAAKFLADRTGDLDRQAARAVAAEFEGLPLALEQAASYVLASGIGLSGYQQLLQQDRTAVLARQEPADYSKTVATAWSLAFRSLARDAPAAVGLLRLLASCAPEPVPLDLMLLPARGTPGVLPAGAGAELAGLVSNQIAVSDAVAELRRYSLVTFAAPNRVLLHRLVQAVTLDQMTRAAVSRWREAAAALIEAALPASPSDPNTWGSFAALLPHARAVLDPSSNGMERIADYLAAAGHHAAAREHYAELLQARDRALGPRHPDTLAARYGLVSTQAGTGDPVSGRAQYEALLPLMEELHGPDHHSTLAVRMGIAGTAGLTGDAVAARDQYAMLLPAIERVLGTEHPTTINARRFLASWTGTVEGPGQARDQYSALLPAAERALGAEHPDTLNIRGELASWTGEAGDPDEARDQYAALLPVAERVLGPEHPDTLTIRRGLASSTSKAGHPAAARNQYAALLPLLEKILVPGHPATLTVRMSVAGTTGLAGDPVTARDQYKAMLPDIENAVGPEHLYTLAARRLLASWTGTAGNPAAARDQMAALLEDTERALGTGHHEVSEVRKGIEYWTRLAAPDANA